MAVASQQLLLYRLQMNNVVHRANGQILPGISCEGTILYHRCANLCVMH